MEIKENLIKQHFNKGRTQNIKYIVIHYTAGRKSTPGSAQSTRNYFNTTTTKASAHYIVDDGEIIQAVKDTDTAWHCGTTGTYYSLCRNSNSIGIEMCSTFNGENIKDAYDPGWSISEKTVKNTVELTKYLMKKYNIPITNVLRHYDVTHKICPAPFVLHTELWDDFLYNISKEQEEEVVMYKTLNEVPEWGKKQVSYFVEKGYIAGESSGNLNISYDLLRFMVIMYRILEDKGVL